MRLLVALIWLVGCAHLSAVDTVESAPAPGLHLTSREVHYAVRGAGVRELRAEMQRIGPIDDGGHQFAHTWGNYAWRYPFHRSDAGCGTGPVSVELEIVQTFPEWISRGAAGEWDRWLAATRAHEDGHRRILLEGGQRLISEMTAIAAQPDCDQLARAANQRGNEILQEMRARHASYDKETDHGATTGARLRSE